MFSLTPGVLRMTGSAAALVSFVESGGLLRELAGVEVSASQVERAAEALGAEIAAEEHNCVEPAGDVAPTMCLGMDGTGVPMRNSEVAGRAGKQPDGSAKTREAKVVTIWTAESRDDQGKPMRDPGSVTYSAAIESAAARDTHPERASALLLLSFGGIKPHQPDLAPLHQSNSPPTGLLSSHSRSSLLRGAFNRATKVPFVLPIASGGNFARTAGFAVPLTSAGTKTTGVVRCGQPRALDLGARNGRKLETVADAIMDEVLARLAPIFE
jgi:mRNA-degrading endonuclease toxin of MazEF toxin-antitoxin module